VPLRLAILTPRFWPWTGDAETHLLRLAALFRQCGHQVTVVTPQWHRDWPRQMLVREVPLVRLRGAPLGGLSTLRYMYSLKKWLREQQGQVDAVLVSRMRHEAASAVRAFKGTNVPVIVQAEQAGPAGDVAWHRKVGFGSRIAARCRQATALVATDELVHQELLAADYDGAKVTTIQRGVPIPPLTNPAVRDQARSAIAGVNHDLLVSNDAPVALTIARFEAGEGLRELVQAWRPIAARWPLSQLWMVGDGPLREELYRLISDLDLRYRVLLPGTFSPMDELYQAADLFIRPALVDGPTLRLADALAAGLPAITTDLAGHRVWIDSGRTGVLVPPRDTKALSEAIRGLLDDPARAVALGSAAREQIKQEHSLDRCVQQYQALFDRLV
jgi:glycosyltransferase involved in cell wall biosynthesis